MTVPKWEHYTEQELQDLIYSCKNKSCFFTKLGYSRCDNRAWEKIIFKYPNLDYSCWIIDNRIDLVGKTFGRWTVLKLDESKKGTGSFWICQCNCKDKTIKSIRGTSLQQGKTKSCGCLRADNNRQMTYKDMTGQIINGIKVISINEKITKTQPKRGITWNCECPFCHKIFTATRNALQQKLISSCGCIVSKGNYKIKQILLENNVNFKTEYSFNDLRGVSKPLRFDFAIFKDNKLYCLLEYQGRQHYESSDYFGGEERFKQQKEYDKKKVKYCKDKNIPLYFITYNEYNKITFDFLKERMNLDV